MGPITDTRGIDYIACILAALRTDERPWGSIRKLKDKSIAKKVKKIIERYVANSSVASARIAAKATADSDGVPVSYMEPTERLLGFLPPPFRNPAAYPVPAPTAARSATVSVTAGCEAACRADGLLRI